MSDRESTDSPDSTEPTQQPTEDPLIPASVRNGVVGFLAILALVAFVAMYGLVFYYTLVPKAQPKGLDDPQLLSVSTALTGLIAGVVAVALAQQQDLPPPPGGNGGNLFTRNRLVGWFFRLNAKSKLATLYVLVYLLFGIAAVLVWIIAGPDAPNTVQALASVSIGLLIPIVRAYFIPSG